MKSKLTIGTKVRLRSTGEVGIVIYAWYEEEIAGEDCYIAFFGEEFPKGKPLEKPYVLRYAPESLEVIE